MAKVIEFEVGKRYLVKDANAPWAEKDTIFEVKVLDMSPSNKWLHFKLPNTSIWDTAGRFVIVEELSPKADPKQSDGNTFAHAWSDFI